MAIEETETERSRSYPADRLFNVLARNPYRPLGMLWEKAVDRIDMDPSGAITASKSLLEAACKMVLERTGASFDPNSKLPKLYSAASTALNVAPAQQTNQTYRAVFGAVHTIIQGVGEFRNDSGDAHGSHRDSYTTSTSEAELAVNLAGSIVLFLLSTLESFLTLKKRVGSDGRIVLRFEKSMIWRLVDHARNSPEHLQYYGEDTGPALWLVGDAGIYLMSNGSPRLGDDGLLIEPGKENSRKSLRVCADGCDPSIDEFERWWVLHGAIDENSDFCIPIDTENFLAVLTEADSSIVVIVGPDDHVVYPDTEFKHVFGASALT